MFVFVLLKGVLWPAIGWSLADALALGTLELLPHGKGGHGADEVLQRAQDDG